MTTEYPTYPATTFEQAVSLAIFSSNQLHDVVNEDATTVIETENGYIPSLRKALVDNFYFKTPLVWAEGTSVSVFNQLYYFAAQDQSLSGLYYAPSATTTNPISMQGTPVGDANFVLYSAAASVKPAIFSSGLSISSYGRIYYSQQSNGIYASYAYIGNLPYEVTASTPEEDQAGVWTPINTTGIWLKLGEGNVLNIFSSEDADKGDALVTVKQPYAGAIARTQHDKNTDFISVKDFGAKGDGETDDSASFTAAINSAAQKLWIPAGTYILSTALPLKANFEIQGERGSVLKLKDNLSVKPGSLFDKSDTPVIENVKLSGFTIDLNRLNNWTFGPADSDGNETEGASTLGVGVRSINGLVLDGLTILNSRRDGIWVVNCRNFMVTNCHVYDCCNTAISIRNDGDTPNSLQNGLIEGNVTHGCTVGLHGIFAVSNCTYSGNVSYDNTDENRFKHNYAGTYPNVYPNIPGYNTPSDEKYKTFATEGDGAGIEFTTSPMDPVKQPANRNISVTGNTCNSNIHGIRAEGASNHLTISGNNCNNNTRYGVLILATSPLVINGNTLVGNGIAGVSIRRPTDSESESVGTIAPAPSGISLTGNLITASGLHGIELISVNHSSMVGNTVFDNNKTQSSTGGAIGIYSTDSVPSVCNTISANVFRGGAKSPCVFYSKDGLFSANAISANVIQSFDTISNDVNLFYKNLVGDNVGYDTDLSGVVTLTSGAKSVHVTTTAGFQLTNGRVQVTPANDAGGCRWWVGNPSGNGFDIFLNTPSSSDIQFYWRCS